jgi:hypothetical protein
MAIVQIAGKRRGGAVILFVRSRLPVVRLLADRTILLIFAVVVGCIFWPFHLIRFQRHLR